MTDDEHGRDCDGGPGDASLAPAQNVLAATAEILQQEFNLF